MKKVEKPEIHKKSLNITKKILCIKNFYAKFKKQVEISQTKVHKET